MATEQGKNLWVVVVCSGIYYLGCSKEFANKQELVDSGGTEFLILHDVVTINVIMMPVPGGAARHVAGYPFCNTLLGAPLHVKPSAIQFLEDMHEDDQKRYKDMAAKAAEIAQEIRMKSVGIEPAAGGIPHGEPKP